MQTGITTSEAPLGIGQKLMLTAGLLAAGGFAFVSIAANLRFGVSLAYDAVRSHHLWHTLDRRRFDENRASSCGGCLVAEEGADICARGSGILDRRGRIFDMRRDWLCGFDARSRSGDQRKSDRSPQGMGSQDYARRGAARSARRASSIDHYSSRNGWPASNAWRGRLQSDQRPRYTGYLSESRSLAARACRVRGGSADGSGSGSGSASAFGHAGCGVGRRSAISHIEPPHRDRAGNIARRDRHL